MNRRFWLPCSCGKRHVIDASQAGESLKCSCGIVLEVPPLRHLVHLEKLPDDGGDSNADTWGWRQRLVLSGGVILIFAAIFSVYLFVTWPTPPWSRGDWQKHRQEIAAMSPWKTHQLWLSLLRPLDSEIPPEKIAEFQKAVQRHRGLAVFTALLAVAGLGSLIASRFVSPPGRSP